MGINLHKLLFSAAPSRISRRHLGSSSAVLCSCKCLDALQHCWVQTSSFAASTEWQVVTLSAPLESVQAEALRFPLSMTPAMPDVDKKGEHCTVFDCCMNIDVIKMVRHKSCLACMMQHRPSIIQHMLSCGLHACISYTSCSAAGT
jgi:hypothetical protein